MHCQLNRIFHRAGSIGLWCAIVLPSCRQRVSDESGVLAKSASSVVTMTEVNDAIAKNEGDFATYNSNTLAVGNCKDRGAQAGWNQVQKDYYCSLPGESDDPDIGIRACFTGRVRETDATGARLYTYRQGYDHCAARGMPLDAGIKKRKQEAVFLAVMIDPITGGRATNEPPQAGGQGNNTNNGSGGSNGGVPAPKVIAGWDDVTTSDGTTPSSCAQIQKNCTYRDQISGLSWSRQQKSFTNWSMAVAGCPGITHNGQSGWRLPLKKELIEAYKHQIGANASPQFVKDFDLWFWSGSAVSADTTKAWIVFLADGDADGGLKHNAYSVLCVR